MGFIIRVFFDTILGIVILFRLPWLLRRKPADFPGCDAQLCQEWLAADMMVNTSRIFMALFGIGGVVAIWNNEVGLMQICVVLWIIASLVEWGLDHSATKLKKALMPTFTCPHCNTQLVAFGVGANINCPSCKAAITLPTAN